MKTNEIPQGWLPRSGGSAKAVVDAAVSGAIASVRREQEAPVVDSATRRVSSQAGVKVTDRGDIVETEAFNNSYT